MADVQLLVGDCREVLKTLPDCSVNCCVTSPPYFGLRDYGTAKWEGGDQNCSHSVGGQVQDNKAPGAITTGQRPGVDSSRCRKCGARRVDSQIGLEQTPESYVANLVEVFREVKRVLRDDGTLWLNLGDSYVGATSQHKDGGSQGQNSCISQKTMSGIPSEGRGNRNRLLYESGLAMKQLIGIPWRVAFALQADGWYLRQDIIWHKPNPMPESVTDRCTKAHEYIFLLTKSAKYYYDAEAVKEACETANPESASYRANGKSDSRKKHAIYCPSCDGSGDQTDENGEDCHECGGSGLANIGGAKTAVKNEGFWKPPQSGRNRRSVWTVTTKPYKGAHFATFPPDLIRPCILAGCPQGGTVIDPFGGSGTTGEVCEEEGRNSILIELNPEYVKLAKRRTAQAGLFCTTA